MCFDRMDYYYEKALAAYCRQEKKDPDALSDEEQDEIALRAANHIGFFLTWIIRRDFVGELHRERPQRLEDVRTGKLSGADFFLAECDGKLWDEDVCPEILPFVETYYRGGQYWKDYVNWVLNDLCDLPLEFAGSWEDYLRFEPLLDRAYRAFEVVNTGS